jgi:hypothetical protein
LLRSASHRGAPPWSSAFQVKKVNEELINKNNLEMNIEIDGQQRPISSAPFTGFRALDSLQKWVAVLDTL